MMMLFFSHFDPSWDESTLYELSAENADSFCSALTDPAHVGACLRASWPLYPDKIKTGPGLDAFCSNQPNQDETRECYSKLFITLGWLNISDAPALSSLCTTVSEPWREMCYERGVSEYVASGGGVLGVSNARTLCNLAQGNHNDACMGAIASISGLYTDKDTDAREKYCRSVPDAWREQCYASENR